MSTKKPSTKKPAKKSTAKAQAKKPTAGCPKGGAHEWRKDDDGTTNCAKCFEPAGGKPKTKAAAKAKTPQAKGESMPKKLSALDAAAKVLAESKEPLNTRQMIEAMATKGYWKSPGGATPWATLYSALLREINAKGKDARFKKTDRGQFAFNG